MTTGLTNYATGVDPAVSGHLCATDAVEPARSDAAIETAASEPEVCPNTDPNTALGADSWRVEVAARLERYRTRRKPRTPRYPSLLLPFDAPESWSRPTPPGGSTAVATASARAEQDFTLPASKEERTAVEAPSFAEPRQTPQQAEPSAKVIEFPRSAAIPVFHPSELADPVFDCDRPRIVEAPEILPPPPALGGMLMEPALQEPADSRAGANFPLPSAASPSSIARRALAALVDGVVLAAALAAFAAIFLRLNPTLNPSLNPIRGSLPIFVGMLAAPLGVVALLLWMAYEFLFVVYTGSTPGLHAARLRLAGFDGSPLNRRLRRWRVLATFSPRFPRDS